jgi:opacity protein-like surface antigen
MKQIWLTGLMSLLLASSASAATINAKGAAGVCVAVTTGSVVTVLDYSVNRTNATIYANQDMNCEPGLPTGGAPATAPTTGGIGTGKGFPIVKGTYVTIGPGRSVPLGASVNLNLDPAARTDCIAATSNGYVCTWEGQ